MVQTASNPTQSFPPARKRAAIYVRVSDRKQEREGTSLQSQEEYSRAYCTEQGYSVEPAHVYREVMSGVIYRERPQLNTLREAARRGEFDVVVVYELDRLAREDVHQTVIMEDLAYHHVSLECVRQKIEDTPVGRYIVHTYGLMAAVEHEKILERTQRGMRTRIESGKMPGTSFPAYGYQWADEKKTAYAINEAEAAVVRRMFAMAARGDTIRSIAVVLTKEGIPTRKNSKLWRASTIGQMLKNPYYIGKASANKWLHTRVPGQKTKMQRRPEEEQVALPDGVVPAIVDLESFAIVQKRLQQNREQSPRNNKAPQDTLLRCGLAICGYCGGKMEVHRSNRDNRIDYRCYRGNLAMGECQAVSISNKILDAAAWRRAVEIIQDPMLVSQKIAQRREEKKPTDIAVELKPIEARLEEVKGKIRNISAVAEDITEEDARIGMKLRLRELGEEKRKLEKMRADLLIVEEDEATVQAKIDAFAARCAEWRVKLADPLAEFTYQEKREALEFFGIKALVWRPEHKPRHQITASPPSIMSARACA